MPKYSPDWSPILRAQEDALRVDAFTNADALKLGLLAVEECRRAGGGFAVRVVHRDSIAFQHLMDGATAFHEWWMGKKLNACRKLGMSTLRGFCAVREGALERAEWMDDEGNYALNGGCVPLLTPAGAALGWLLVSGGHHEDDHMIAVRAIAAFLNTKAPELPPAED